MKQSNRFHIGLIYSPFSFSLVALLVMALQVIISSQLFAQVFHDPAQEKIGEIARSYYQSNVAGSKPGGLEKTTVKNEHYLTGAAAGDEFGYSVSSAGDVNGDGYADIIVGAWLNDAGGTNAGRAYIYFGGVSLHSTPDVTLTGTAQDDHFGISVSSAGDVNGDGYGDVIVGAIYGDVGGPNVGTAYIFFGGASMDTTPDVILAGAAAGDWFGISVSSAGDVNGDGYSDVVVGAMYNDAAFTDAGRAYIYFGGASMNTTADVTLSGAAAGDAFGYSVSSAGDVNGDGYSDVIVGAVYNDAAFTDAGRAYIFFGGASMNTTPDVILTGTATGAALGYSVSSAGDVNGDGYDDVIVGARYNNSGTGNAYIYFGGASMDTTPDVTFAGDATYDYFGCSVSGAGDVNGDGYSDVIVGAFTNDAGGTDAGRAYVFFGGTSMDTTPDVTLTGAATNDYFGCSVSSAGDMNGDGYSDILVGAYANDAGGYSAGRVYINCNSLTGTDIADVHLTGVSGDDRFGYSVSNAGDVNGDGYGDVIVGAIGQGRAYIFFGGVSMNNTPNVTLTGATANDWFGCSVSSAGDVNGDGYSDVIVGAKENDAAYKDAGTAYIYFGGASMDATVDVILTGAAAGDWFGYSVSSAGDFNGDGYGDVIVGAPLNDTYGDYAGGAYIYFGGVSMDNIPDIPLWGPSTGGQFGYSVSDAGDFNGDGYSDVIIGALYDGVAGSNAGKAYVFFGGASIEDAIDVELTGAAADDYFGCSVSSAGDVNGDGYSDVIVGADGNDASGTHAGSAYIYFGGAGNKHTTPDVTLTGGAAYDCFGYSVSSAGDVNCDGYSDVIVGANQSYVGGPKAGSAYIYFGGVSIDDTPDITFKSTTYLELFGSSVSNAGDINGDGYGDVVVGGNNLNDAYLYLSSSLPIVPRIARVSDVKFDQGGSVDIRWIRSGYDARGINRVTSYVIERSKPPGTGGFAWEEIANITARHNPQYSYAAATQYDSTVNSSGTFFFRVTATTTNPDEYWRSNIMAGHSVDNISPSTPGILRLSPLSSGPIELSWSLNRTDPDVWGYRAYRSTSSGFAVGPSTLVLSTIDTLAIDSTVAPGTIYYYRVTAVDIHGNESTPSEEKSQGTVGVENSEEVIPRVFSLHQNYPNPFNPTTTIEFTVGTYGHTSLRIYDMLGREVAMLVNKDLEAGAIHHVTFDASRLSTGMYFYRLQSGDNVQVKKLILLK